MIRRPRAAYDDHDLVFGNKRDNEGTHAGNAGAADAPSTDPKPQLLGPNGQPISSKPPAPPFGFNRP